MVKYNCSHNVKSYLIKSLMSSEQWAGTAITGQDWRSVPRDNLELSCNLWTFEEDGNWYISLIVSAVGCFTENTIQPLPEE